ncbi:MAG: hypothetical protein IIZ25_07710 [Thermoguttaceae bacterium]|nr:hypothetical protein [Thermoguttaceae bacterium]
MSDSSMSHTFPAAFRIGDLRARTSVASRGGALTVEVVLESGVTAGAAVSVERDPAGLVDLVNERLADELFGFDVREQTALDALLVELDGTADRSVLPRELLFAVSAAAAAAAAKGMRLPLYRWLGGALASEVPRLLPFGEETAVGGKARFITPAKIGTVTEAAAAVAELKAKKSGAKAVPVLRGDLTDETFCVDLAIALAVPFVESGWEGNISLANRLAAVIPPCPSAALGR